MKKDHGFLNTQRKFDMIQINYNNQTSYKLNDLKEMYSKIATYALKQFDYKGKYEVSCTFVSKNVIHEINNTYRHVDRVTDVISFENGDDDIVDGFIALGDLFICPFKAKKQAKEYGHSFYREMCFLFTHGMLHLLHMDHQNEKEEKEMFAMQDKILNHFNITR